MKPNLSSLEEFDAVEQESSFDMRAALNNPQFLKYIEDHDKQWVMKGSGSSTVEEIEKGDNDAVERKFRSFESSIECAKDLKDAYQEVIKKELGIELSAKDLECIDTAMRHESIVDPDHVSEIAGIIGDNRLYKQKAIELQAKAQELYKKVPVKDMHYAKELVDQGITTKKQIEEMIFEEKGFNVLDTIYIKLFPNSKEVKEFKNTVSKFEADIQAYKTFNEIDTNYNTLNTQYISNLKQLFKETKVTDTLSKKIQEKVNEKLLEACMSSKSTLDSMNTSQDTIDKLSNEDNFIQYVSPEELDAMQDLIDEKFAALIDTEVDSILTTTESEKAYDKLEKKIADLKDKENIGSLEGDELKDRIVILLKQKQSALPVAKRVMVAYLIRQLTSL